MFGRFFVFILELFRKDYFSVWDLSILFFRCKWTKIGGWERLTLTLIILCLNQCSSVQIRAIIIENRTKYRNISIRHIYISVTEIFDPFL